MPGGRDVTEDDIRMRPLHRSRMFRAGLGGCLLIAGLWVSSCYREYSAWVNLPGGTDAVFLTQEANAVSINHRRYHARSLGGSPFFSAHGAPRVPRDRDFRFRWLQVMWNRPFFIDHTQGVKSDPFFTMSRLVVPYWLLMLFYLLGWSTAAAWMRRRRRRSPQTVEEA